METSKLRKFASFARKSLIEQVGTKMKTVLAEGSLARRENPKAVADLEAKIADLGKQQTIETVAYTWFNRFCALRYMDVNRYTKIGILSPAEGQFLPEILGEAKAGHLDDEMVPKATREKVLRILDGTDPSNDPQGEAYRLLLVAACNHYHSLMPFLFEKISHFTELLLPDDLLSGSAIPTYTREALLPANCSPEHTEESVEVIGWLYQFYIADKKDDVFASLKKGKKITPENIPAATQLFTPHWIVRYLVENSLGRLWMLNHPESKLVERMEYYIKPEEVDSEQCSVNSGERDGSSELSRVDRLAEVDGRGRADLSGDKEVPERGNLWTNESDSASGGIDPIQHRGGTSSHQHRGVQELSLDSAGIQSGSRDSANDRSSSGVRDSGRSSSDSQPSRGSIKDDGISPRKTEGLSGQWTVSSGQKETDHSSLTTDHLRISSPEEIRICDPACGSGHMLTYAFDLLYAIYEEQGYNPTEIPRLILAHNLYGIEIDARAGALAAFALTMKAREKDRRFFSRPPIKNPKSQIQNQTIQNPNICVLENISVDPQEFDDYMDKVGRDLFSGGLQGVVNQWEEADNFGSLIRPLVTDVSEVLELLRERKMDEDLFLQETHQKVLKALRQADYLSPKYHVVVANPPYMGKRGMNGGLRVFATGQYEDTNTDAFAMFIQRNLELTLPAGSIAMVTMQSWMFLPSYEDLRERVLDSATLLSMAHLGPHAFDTISGEIVSTTAFVLGLLNSPEYHAQCIRAVDGKSEADKIAILLSGSHTYMISTKEIREIPSVPFAYWTTSSLRSAFSQEPIRDFATVKQGLATGDNERFLRYWHEVSHGRIEMNLESYEQSRELPDVWVPYSKGGSYRKWYGNHDYVVRWQNGGETIRLLTDDNGSEKSRFRAYDYYFRPATTWSLTSSNSFGCRHRPKGHVFDINGMSLFANDESQTGFLTALLNSSTGCEILGILNPTMAFQIGDIGSVPVCGLSEPSAVQVGHTAATAIDLAKDDWDGFERSWEFLASPLLVFGITQLSDSWHSRRNSMRRSVELLRERERELNAQFASYYGCESVEIDVAYSDVTLTCNPAYRYGSDKSESELESLLLADTMREFISYAVGCMLGRYSLDKPGLILANQGDTFQDYLSILAEQQDASGENPKSKIQNPKFLPDEDNVIPMLDGDWFTDDITERFKEFLKATFGTEHYEANLAFLENALCPENANGKKRKTIRDYFLKGFYDHHVRLYKTRPIYWLFSSPKGTFNALIYMHRYRPDTVSTVLQYLRDFRDKLAHRRDHQQMVADSGGATTAEKTKALKEVAALKKQLKELEDYERDTLFPLAQKKLNIDLNDGVKHNYPLFGKALKKITGLDG